MLTNRKSINLKKNTKKTKGFTLIELIVAVTILSIIVVPLLGAFVRSSKINSKSRVLARATNVAESVIENFKTYPLEHVVRNFNDFDVDGYGNNISVNFSEDATNKFEAYNIDGTYYKCNDAEYPASAKPEIIKSIGSSGELEDTIEAVRFIGRENDEYSFILTGLKSADSSVTLYDATADIKAVEARDIASITSTGKGDCGYYIENPTEKTMVLNEYWNSYLAKSGGDVSASEGGTFFYSEEDMQQYVSQKIDVNIEQTALGTINVSVSHTYTFGDSSIFRTVEERTQTFRTNVFSNFVSEADLNAVYIYYYPFYTQNNTSIQQDTFNIKNSTGEEVAVYLICMHTETDKSGLYSAKIAKIENSNIKSDDGTKKEITKICTNIQNDAGTLHLPDDKPDLGINNLGNVSNIDLKYEVTVKLYKHNEKSFNGIAFVPNEDDYVMSFTGSFLDNSDLQKKGWYQ